MMKKRMIGAISLVLVWALLAGFAWFGPKTDFSLSERRPLDKLPALNGESLWSGKFMGSFEEYTLDQFPLRDRFRSLKAMVHYYALGQQDNNGIYIEKGHVAELAYPLDTGSVSHALQQFQAVYDRYLHTAENIYATVVPDKGYYLARQSGHPSLDYQQLFDSVRNGMPWAEFIDITDTLALEDYYTTDTHWRQERLLPVADRLGSVMGFDTAAGYTERTLERPFYGVYYGQAALPVAPDTMVLLENEHLSSCKVTLYDAKTGKPSIYEGVYDLSFYDSPDMYQIYLSGAQSIVRIDNPNAATDRQLVVFRDSYGSSLAPLLTESYATVTLVDIRYILPQALGSFVDFADCDVLFMYSSLVLNKNLI